MSMYHTLALYSLVSVAAVFILVDANRFGRNDARCMVICSNRNSEECQMCNTRIPMRFGKRSNSLPGSHLYDLSEVRKPDVRLLALVQDREDSETASDNSYSDEE